MKTEDQVDKPYGLLPFDMEYGIKEYIVIRKPNYSNYLIDT